MVFLRGSNVLGPYNRDERGAYEDLDDKVKSYMLMSDEEWNELYSKMYNDRKYPGFNNLKLLVLSSLFYGGVASTFAYEMYLKRVSMFKSSGNLTKLFLIPVLSVLTFRGIDMSYDLIKFRNKYPEMYQN